MKRLSNYEKLGIIIGEYYHLSDEHLASYLNVSPIVITETLEKFRGGRKYKIAMFYLKSAEPYYEEFAKVLFCKNARGPRFNDGIDNVVKSFNLSKYRIIGIEKKIMDLKIKVLNHSV